MTKGRDVDSIDQFHKKWRITPKWNETFYYKTKDFISISSSLFYDPVLCKKLHIYRHHSVRLLIFLMCSIGENYFSQISVGRSGRWFYRRLSRSHLFCTSTMFLLRDKIHLNLRSLFFWDNHWSFSGNSTERKGYCMVWYLHFCWVI